MRIGSLVRNTMPVHGPLRRTRGRTRPGRKTVQRAFETPGRALAPAARALGAVALVLLVLLVGPPAHAQTQTTGEVRGVVVDSAGAPVAGAIVTIKGPALQGTVGDITGAEGSYEIGNLPPGLYTITASEANAQISRSNVLVQLGKVSRVNIRFQVSAQGEVIQVRGRAPMIDQGSTKIGVTLSESDVGSLPTGRNFDELLEIAPGAQPDRFGVSFNGSTSPENTYLIDGMNATDVGFGLATLSLPMEFVQEMEVISGGYGAEYGRSSGGVVNVITKSGGNEFHGSVFGYLAPGALAGSTRFLPNENNSIVFQRNLGYRTDFGAEVGGPLIPDSLWFHAGFSPSLQSEDTDRVRTRIFDANGDQQPDRAPDGTIAYEELDRRTIDVPGQTYYFTGKLTYAASPEHRGYVSLFGNPSSNDLIFDEFAVGPDETLLIHERQGVVAGVAHWTSDVLDGDGQVQVTWGVQRGRDKQDPGLPGGELQAVRILDTVPLEQFAEYEDPAVPGVCLGDDADGFINCPVTNYQVGGIDFFNFDVSVRAHGTLAYRHILDALGRHRVKVGVDVEDNRFDSRTDFSGGSRWWVTGDTTLGIRFLQPDPAGDVPCGIDADGDGALDGLCSQGSRGRLANTRTLNLGAFVQDSWTILPNLAVELGLRYERQSLGSADQVTGMVDPFTGDTVGDTAVVLNNLAPRAGVIYDWTNEGRSRVFGHWGRYFESVPMDLNARGFSGETLELTFYDRAGCSDETDPATYNCDGATVFGGQQLGNSKLVAPDLGGQYMDEIVAGVEYEPIPDLKVGATYVHRDLGRAIEDVSPDGNTLVLANPGEVDFDAVDDLRDRADEARADGDMLEADRLDRAATAFEAVGRFDRPRRVYDALELSLVKRFSQQWTGRLSYTYSALRGNFAGLFSPDTNQLDPNFTSVYDLPELMFNRDGRLPGDLPHQVKLDAFYQLPVEGVGTFVFGGRARGSSGRPHNYLASHPVYGQGESFLLPRGSGERNPFTTGFDLQLAYGRALGGGMGVELFLSVFNVFNQQLTRRRDELYTFDVADPIGGGDLEDLEHAKNEDAPDGRVVSKNPNFDNATELQAPVSVRFGARVTF
jgi:outer membrane receptor protein involved in Fe transport